MAAAICPYCRMALDDGPSPDKVFCNGCGTPHHQDCYNENGGCTVFGCRCAPADDPKLQVSYSEVQTAPGYPPQATPASPQYPPSLYGGPLGLSQIPAGPVVSPVQTNTAPTATPVPDASPHLTPPPGTGITPAPIRAVTLQPAPPAMVAGAGAYPYAQAAFVYARAPRSRTGFILLGVFLGALGVHNFYAGYVGKGVGQLCLSLLTLGYGAVISWVWAIVEICVIDKDGFGTPFD